MGKVLVVEDNELNLKLFCDLLAIKKCDVIISKDGANIVELVSRENPNLILMDIQLYGTSCQSGFDLINKLKNRELTKHVPIIIVTAIAVQEHKQKLLQSQYDMYISKPFSIEHFFKVISKFI